MGENGDTMEKHALPIREFAPAKVNLYLHVVGWREDGYHLLDSLVVFAGVGDTVTLSPAAGVPLRLSGPFGPLLAEDPSENIVLKTVRLLADAVGRTPDVAITLDKRLPVAAGLGGGSADAAAILRGLIRLWQVELSPERLVALALALGADVPVCLYGAPARVSGIGEEIEPAPGLPAAWLLLVNPLRPLATAAVFKARTEGAGSAASPLSVASPMTEAPEHTTAFAQALASRCNDLQDPARSLLPEIGAVLEALEAVPGCLLARMSGSGATCFGLFADGTAARAAARALVADRPAWWSQAAPLLPPT
ncbi:MAG: 4-diphosphocytidyl-2-C-methyl-D-erythritol kinase [Rhodospirillaceae bacterium]|nr:MAG: 4-diphosphocytidyl-2-C-methyl-D-erythritol kinase [Rhodospirillaceae bacterium]